MELTLTGARSAARGAEHGRFGVAVFAIAAVFYALAFLGLFTEGDAALFLILVAVVGRRVRPFLLVMAASVQDAPGCSYVWSYVGFAVVAAVTVADELLRNAPRPAAAGERSLAWLALLALTVASYCTIASWMQSAFGGYAQAAQRPYYFVGALMAVMILAGFFGRRALDRREGDRRLLGGLAVFSTVHALLIGILQIPLGQEFYRSSGSLLKVELSQQLMEAGAIGFARINGPFLSPNAYGYTMIQLATLSILTLFDTARLRVFFLYIAVGLAAVLLSMSKALLGYYGLVCAVLLAFVARRGVIVFVYLLGFVLLGWFLTSDYFQLLLAIFRVQEGSLGSRQTAWLAVIQSLQPLDWVFGIGLSAWPPFFESKVGLPLSDPHSLPLSIAGTFGLPGVVFYAALIVMLLRRGLQAGADDVRRLGIWLLLLLFLVKDLVSIPTVLGNTPLTFMIWLLLGLVLTRPVYPEPSPQ
jgi:hypothetical protein